MFDREKLAEIAEEEAKHKILWTPTSDAAKYTKKFESVFGKRRFPWCAAFVTWCCEQAGLEMPVNCPSKFGKTFALCEAWQQWAMEIGFYHDNDGIFKPTRGDLVLFDWNQTSIDEIDQDWEEHIGIYLSPYTSYYRCAEGNVQNATKITYRPTKHIQGFILIPTGFSFDMWSHQNGSTR